MTIIVVPKRKMLPLQKDTVQPKPIDVGESILPLLAGYLQDADLVGYLKNLIEDTTPQLGGNLDTNGKTIAYGNFKIQLQSDKMWFLTPSMVFQLTPTGALLQVPLDMNNEKITDLKTPTADADGATKKYVDDNIGSISVTDVADIGSAIDTIYQNDGVASRIVYITVRLDDGESVDVQFDSGTPPTTQRLSPVSANARTDVPITLIVPANWYYRIETLSGTPTIVTWDEFRLGG